MPTARVPKTDQPTPVGILSFLWPTKMPSNPVKASQHPISPQAALPVRLKSIPSSLYDDPAFSNDPTLHPYFVTSHSSRVNETLPDPRHLKTAGQDHTGRPHHRHTKSFPTKNEHHPTFRHIPPSLHEERIRHTHLPLLTTASNPSTPGPTVTSPSPSHDMRPPHTELLTNYSDVLVTSHFAEVMFPPGTSRQADQHNTNLPPPYTEIPNVPSLRHSSVIGMNLDPLPQASSSVSSVTDSTSLSNRIKRPFKPRRRKVLDRIDELDETNPLGISLHHESPYEAVTRLVRPAVNATRPIGGLYQNQHLNAPNPLERLPGSYQTGIIKSAETAPNATYLSDGVTYTSTLEASPKQVQPNEYASIFPWNVADETFHSNSPLQNPHIHYERADQYSEFDPYDPNNLDGPTDVRRNLALPLNNEVRSTANTWMAPVHPGSNHATQHIDFVRSSQDKTIMHLSEQQSYVVHQDTRGLEAMQRETTSTQIMMNNKAVSMTYSLPSNPDNAETEIEPGSHSTDDNSVIHSTKSGSGSSQMSRSFGKPQSRYFPKKLVMPAPLQSSVISSTSNHAISIHGPVTHQRSFVPASNDVGPRVNLQDTSNPASRKLRKRVTPSINPVDNVDKLGAEVRFADTLSMSISGGKLGHGISAIPKKRVLSKKRAGF